MNKKVRIVIFSSPLLLFLGLAGLFWSGLGHDPGALPSALLNKPMPNFKLDNLLKPSEKLTPQIFLGHVSVVNVWASWCFTCRSEHAMLMKITQYKGFVLYGIDYKDQLDLAQSWLKTFGDPYALTIYDPQGTLGIDLGVYGVPETYVLDKQGLIRYKLIGEVTQQTWDEKLWPAIQKLQ
jgi:cytochrome c biogenesis protein CcmG/thiol:disulfide interchange protein DsbE